MNIITKQEFAKLIEKNPETAVLLHSHCGVLIILRRLSCTDDSKPQIDEMSFELKWRSCQSAIKEINDCERRHANGIQPTSYNTIHDAVKSFMNLSVSNLKFVSIADSELEQLARRFPNDMIYLHIIQEQNATENNKKRRQNAKT